MALHSLRLRRALTTASALLNRNHSLPHIPSPSRLSSSLLETLISPPLPSPSSPPPFQSPDLRVQFRMFQTSSVLHSPKKSFGDDIDIGPDTILFEGCDYNHWLITMDFPKDPKPTPEEMVETYVQTLAKGLNISIEEAKKKMYACSTTTYQGFQAVMTEEESQKFEGLPGVVFVLPDSYIDPVNKEYGGDKYINGTIIPRAPPVQYGRTGGRYNDRNRNYDRAPRYDRGLRNDGPQQNYSQPLPNHRPPQQNYGPPQQNYGPPQPNSGAPQQNYGPPRQNYGPPQQNYGPPQQNYGPPQQNYGPPQQNYGPPQQNNGPPQQNYVRPQQNYGPPQQNYGPEQNYGSPEQNHGPLQTFSGNQVGQGNFSAQERRDIPHGQQRDFAPTEQRNFRGDNQNSAPPQGAVYGQGVGTPHGLGSGGSYGQGAGNAYGRGSSDNVDGQVFSQAEQRSGMQGEDKNYTTMAPTGLNQGS